MLSALREMGVSEQGVQIERDGWILLAALSPEVVPSGRGKSEPRWQTLSSGASTWPTTKPETGTRPTHD